MRFVFRGDADSRIGFGHFSRLAALARATHQQVELLTTSTDPAAHAFATRAGMRVHVLTAVPGSDDDARLTREATGDEVCLVVDGYAFRAEWLRAVRGDRRVIAYLDDLARERLDCDVVINANVSGARTRYEVGPQTELLAGPAWAIVHDRFVDARARRAGAGTPMQRLLVTMGGSDPRNATQSALEAIAQLEGAPLDVRVVIGGLNRSRSAIEQAAQACSRHRVETRDAVEDMAAEMLWADAVVSASGVTTTELACIGTPGIAYAIVDNQEPIAEELGRLGMFDVLSPNPTADSILEALLRLRADDTRRDSMFQRQREIIDGLGKTRIVARLVEVCNRLWHTSARDNGG